MAATRDMMIAHLEDTVLVKRPEQTWKDVLPKEMLIPLHFNLPARDLRLRWQAGNTAVRRIKTVKEKYSALSENQKRIAEKEGICSKRKLYQEFQGELTDADKARLDIATTDLIFLFSFPPVDLYANPAENPTQNAEDEIIDWIEDITAAGPNQRDLPAHWSMNRRTLLRKGLDGNYGFGLNVGFFRRARTLLKNKEKEPNGRLKRAPVTNPAKCFETPAVDMDMSVMLCEVGNKLLAHCRANLLLTAQLNEVFILL